MVINHFMFRLLVFKNREELQIRDTERRWKQSCMFCMIKAGSEVTGSVPAPASAGLVDLDSGMVCT